MDQPNGRPSSRPKQAHTYPDRNEEDRAKIHDQGHFAYPTYAKATALRRDNLRHSADELKAHLTKAKKALLELGEVT